MLVAGQVQHDQVGLLPSLEGADPVLPASVLWRQKEQFSDGVGYGWVEALRAHAERVVSPRDLARAAERFPYATPTTAEAYLYRDRFAALFPGEHAARCIVRWEPRWQTDRDTSGRANPFHRAASEHASAPRP